MCPSSQLLVFTVKFTVCFRANCVLSRYRGFCNGAAAYQVWWCAVHISSNITRAKVYRGGEV